MRTIASHPLTNGHTSRAGGDLRIDGDAMLY
jgi:hypothetical protein